jgi:hypothetical protein
MRMLRLSLQHCDRRLCAAAVVSKARPFKGTLPSLLVFVVLACLQFCLMHAVLADKVHAEALPCAMGGAVCAYGRAYAASSGMTDYVVHGGGCIH